MLDYLKDNYWNILLLLNYVIAISAAITVVLKNINPTKTLSYIIVLVFFPFVGLLIYYLFGQEYRKSKIFNRKHVLNQTTIKSINEELEFNRTEASKVENFPSQKLKLVKLLHSNKNSPLTLCNEINILKNGNEKFDVFLKDLKNAEQHIHLEYFILKDDKIGSKVLNILCEKAKQGVKVRLTYDDVGSSISFKMKRKLKSSGVEHYPFMPVVFSSLTGRMNYRNHRKVVVIDGEIAYVGGINISDTYVNYEDNKVFWRDTHLRVVGKAVKSLQIDFFTTWEFVSNQKINIEKHYFPKVACRNDVAVQMASSGPDTDAPNIMEAMFMAITTAEDYVYITTPYLVPNDQMITALQVASKSGVDVRILIPKQSDSWIMKYATDSYLECLLDADISIYHYTKGFVHAKTMVVDDIFATIGTSNMDYRSFNINFEVNAFIYDEKNSQILKQQFLDDLKSAEKIEPKNWLNRPKFEKLKESFCRLWSPLI